MKTELFATRDEELPSSNNNSREKIEKLLALCLTKDRLLLIERNIGADFDLLKQTLSGCFVRVPVQDRPMLAAIRSVKESCQIEWARFGRRLRLSDSLGYFEFDQVDPEMPGQDEMERWCQRREQNGREPLSDEFIAEKLAQLNEFTNETDEPAKVEPQPAEENVSSNWTGPSTYSARDKENREDTGISEHDEHRQLETDSFAGSDQSEEEEFEEEEVEDMNAEEDWPKLVQSREQLVQVLLPCETFLQLFPARVNVSRLSRATAGCLMAFRIAGKEQDNNKVIVDEIASVKQHHDRAKPCCDFVHFKLGRPVAVAQLMAVDGSEITDQLFDEWFYRLAFKNTLVPRVEAKYRQKMSTIASLASMEQEAALPDIGPIIVTRKQIQLLADSLVDMDELNRVLVGCFMTVKIKKFVLTVEKQPKMCATFVVPIARVVVPFQANKQQILLYFPSRNIPIRHRKTGAQLNEVRLKNVGGKRVMDSRQTPVAVQSLLAMKALNIPLPSDEEIAQKWAHLVEVLAKASNRRPLQPVESNVQNRRRIGQEAGINGHGPTGGNGQQQRPKKRRIGTGTDDDDAGQAQDGKRQK